MSTRFDFRVINRPAVSLQVVTLQAPAAVRGGLVGLIQNNVLGSAQFHKQQAWPFDPDVSARRAPEFIALHGDKSEKLIERIGLGMDGRHDERREQQMIRDYLYDQRQKTYPVSGTVGTVGTVGGGGGGAYAPALSPRLQFPPGYAR